MFAKWHWNITKGRMKNVNGKTIGLKWDGRKSLEIHEIFLEQLKLGVH